MDDLSQQAFKRPVLGHINVSIVCGDSSVTKILEAELSCAKRVESKFPIPIFQRCASAK